MKTISKTLHEFDYFDYTKKEFGLKPSAVNIELVTDKQDSPIGIVSDGEMFYGADKNSGLTYQAHTINGVKAEIVRDLQGKETPAPSLEQEKTEPKKKDESFYVKGTLKKKRKKESVREEDVIRSIKRALTNTLEAEEIEYEGETPFGHGYHFEADTANNGESEWFVFLDSDDAEMEAVALVEQDLEEEPSIFTQSWLQNFIYISPTDIRVISGDEADYQVSEMSNEELVEEAGYEDEYAEAEEAEDEAEMDRIIDKAKDDLLTKYSDEMQDALTNDPIGYFVDEQGMYTKEELFELPFIQIDTEEASEDAIKVDGVAHFLDRYDGTEEEIKDEKENKTYYAYGVN